jgi:hypothetical protein
MASTAKTQTNTKVPTRAAAKDPRGTDPREAEAAAKAAAAAKKNEEQEEGDPVPRPRKKKEDPLVTVAVPRPFTLTLDGHIQVRYEAGYHEMPESHATHWYAKAHGVEIK